MKITPRIIFIVIFFFIIGMLISAWYFKTQRVCFDLPKHGGTDEWGPLYWKSIHSIADRIPCGLCREDGKSLFIFAHDLVNFKTEKKIFDKENFSKWLDKIAEIKSKYNATEQ